MKNCIICSLKARFKSPTNFLFSVLLLTLILVLTSPVGYCAQVTLAWDPDSDTDLAGYKIYSGVQSGSYQQNVDVGNVTTYTLTGLNLGTTYYIAATAYNTQGLESGFSNELVYTVPNTCTYSLSPSNASFSTSGGSGSVSVTTQTGCNWNTSVGTSWLTVTTGSGSGSGTMKYTVASNSGAGRTASLTIAGNVFTITQAGVSSYVITASAGSGGTISPSGGVSVQSGANQSFSITPNSGYRIAGVTVDGVSQGAISSYTFSSVSANHTISTSFTLITSSYTLTINKAGTGSGSVTSNPSGTTFPAGTGVTLTASPDANSVFSGWSGACSGTTTTCQVTMNSNLSVTATFSSVSGPPAAITGSATSVTRNSATLNGTVCPNGLSTTYLFQWGRTTSYGNATVVTSVGSGRNSIAVSTNLTSLIANRTYHYRLVATSSAGTTYGADKTFYTRITNH